MTFFSFNRLMEHLLSLVIFACLLPFGWFWEIVVQAYIGKPAKLPEDHLDILFNEVFDIFLSAVVFYEFFDFFSILIDRHYGKAKHFLRDC